MKRWRVAIETLALVAVIAVVKYVLHVLGLEVLELNALFTSVIGASIFLFGLILAGTLGDYKESERIPSEIVSARDSIWEEARLTAARFKGYDVRPMAAALRAVTTAFRSDIAGDGFPATLEAVSALSPLLAALEDAGCLPQYVARLKGEQAAVRKAVLRTRYIQRTDFLPSAYNLLLTVVVFVIVMLLLTGIEPWYTSVLLVALISYLFLYILRLLKVLEQPFQAKGKSRDDVSLFLFDEFEQRLDA